jgi:hypothetical protein
VTVTLDTCVGLGFVADRFLELRKGLDPTRYRLVELARCRLSRQSLLLCREGEARAVAALSHLLHAWELLAVDRVECDAARAELVRLTVDALPEYFAGELADGPRGMAEWAHRAGLIDADYDYDGEGYVDCCSWSPFGQEIFAEIERRDP